MIQGEDESLEDYAERFHFSYKRSTNCTIDKESLNTILLRGVRDHCMDALNLISFRDISKFTCDETRNVCKKLLKSCY
jgi:hypothetical protein